MKKRSDPAHAGAKFFRLGLCKSSGEGVRIAGDMPLFYLHVCEASGFVEDLEGVEYPDLQVARQVAVEGLRDILAGELRRGSLTTGALIEIEDEGHRLLATVCFEDVVSVTREAPARPPRWDDGSRGPRPVSN